FSDQVDNFTQRIETNAIRNIAAVNRPLQANQIIQETSNQINLLRAGNNPLAGNLLNFQLERGKTQDKLTIELKEVNENLKGNIADILGSITKSLLQTLNEEVNKQSKVTINPEELQKKTDKLTALYSSLIGDPKFLELKLALINPATLSEQDVEKIRKFLEDRISTINKFKQIGSQFPISFEFEAGQAGKSVNEFINTQEGRKILGKSGLLDEKGTLNDAGVFIFGRGRTIQETAFELEERATEAQVLLQAYEKFKETLSDSVKQTTGIEENKITKDLLNQTQ
ncbi:MAG: hypothetical protein AABY22_30660, partial [Nanoarchaeota archaeon]